MFFFVFFYVVLVDGHLVVFTLKETFLSYMAYYMPTFSRWVALLARVTLFHINI